MTVQNIEDQDNVIVEPDSSETEKVEVEAAQKEEQRAKSAMGQVKAFQAKIDSGDLSKEEAPAWMQNDLADKVEAESVADVKEKLKKEIRDDIEFEQLQKTLPEDLTEEQAEIMNEVIEAEVKLGRTKTEALQYAKFKAGIVDPVVLDKADKVKASTSFPRIVSRNPIKKENESTSYFMDNMPERYRK